MDNTHKRPREEPVDEPVEPMAPGTRKRGFLAHSSEILELHQGDPRKLSSEATHLLEGIAEHLSENTVGAHTGHFSTVVQLVNTLFEVAAAVTHLARATTVEENRALDLLHDHSLEGLEMIAAEEPEAYDDDDDASD